MCPVLLNVAGVYTQDYFDTANGHPKTVTLNDGSEMEIHGIYGDVVKKAESKAVLHNVNGYAI